MRLIVLMLILGGQLFGMTGLDVMTRVQEETQKKMTRKAVVDMRIYDQKDRERSRYFNYWTKYKGDSEKSLIKFFRPKDVKGTALMTHSLATDDSKVQWIYLPAFKSVKQLSPSDKNKSFMGSDFTYSDIAGRKLNQDTHQLIKENESYYFIESTPNDANDMVYSKIRYVISKAYSVVSKAIFYDLDGKKLKTLNNSEVAQMNGVNVVMASEMVNHVSNGRTILKVESMVVGEEIADDLLSIKGLKTL